MAVTINIFNQIKLKDFLQKNKLDVLENEIIEKSEEYILNVNETEFQNYVIEKYLIEKLEIHFNEVTVETSERMIPSNQFPNDIINLVPGKKYKKYLFKYFIPFTGDDNLFRCRPDTGFNWTTEITLEEDIYMCFAIIDFYNDANKLQYEFDRIKKFIVNILRIINKEIDTYNKSLGYKVQEIFSKRKQYIMQKNNTVASLGIPVRKRKNISPTFSVPTPQTRKKIHVAPSATSEIFQPDPTLDLTIYNEILQVIHDVGKVFERIPSTYSNKREEELRDHFLLVLEPRFEGSATGETFNKNGKTDILLRYEGSNVFIAECKFWTGAKAYLKTISQLLRYLTWRDSKSAVIIFVKNKDFSSVISTVENETSNHSNYLGFVNKKEETWLYYRFHVNGDRNREVKLSVLLFHIPDN